MFLRPLENRGLVFPTQVESLIANSRSTFAIQFEHLFRNVCQIDRILNAGEVLACKAIVK